MKAKINRIPKPNSGIKCVVEHCHFHGNGNHCHAEEIEIQSSNSMSSDMTDCSTFMPE